MERKIIITEDGSHTLAIPEMDEQYHSIHGAIQESNHVFIEAGLKQISQQDIHIFEVGFGTGLNAYLSLGYGLLHNKNIHFTSIEKYPLTENEIDQINYSEKIYQNKKDQFKLLHQSEWNKKATINPNFILKKIENDLRSIDLSKEKRFDLVYFDAFGPDKHPDLWTQKIFDAIFNQCSPNAILVTYCAKGAVRRMIQAAGFTVERIPGPPGKREMIRAIKK